ncbi:hypothetical protein ACOMHN_066002 [Nucella lapillus]
MHRTRSALPPTRGDKHMQENLAYLPSMLLNVTHGVPTMAQWNYRVLCHPVRQDVRARDLRPVEDLANRLASKHRWRDYVMSRAARFSLNPFSAEKIYKWTLLDKIMKEIPAYYHRWYKLRKAMGQKVAHTGFADRNLFVTETTQPRVAPLTVRACSPSSGGKKKKKKKKTCEMKTKRVSYAIPLEVVFLTPLHSWNPYSLQYKGDNQSPEGQTVTAPDRKGELSVEGAFNGTKSRHVYHTPVTFFQSGKEVHSDPADMVKGVVGVLDPKGYVQENRIFQDLINPLPLSPSHMVDLPLNPVVLVTSPSKHKFVALHVHTVDLTKGQWLRVVRDGARVKVRTTLGGGHSHLLEVGFDPDSQ